MTMEGSGSEFPGFQTCVHKEDFIYRRPLSRLQRRAPYPLQLVKPNLTIELKETISSSSSSAAPPPMSSSSAPSSSFNSLYQSKDPIPLLSPLVLPSMLESSYLQEGNTAESH